MMLLLYCWIYY